MPGRAAASPLQPSRREDIFNGASQQGVAMVKAVWNGFVLAHSHETIVVEGNHYFPAEAVIKALLKPSTRTSVCGWKGTANYLSIVADGAENPDAAWFYADPKPAAANIKGRIAFWKGVTVG